MSRARKWIGLTSAGLLLSSALLAQTPARRPDHKISRHRATKPVVLPPMPSGPLPQVPMDQLPSSAPQVSYQNGLLTIVAQNSSLGDILREVRKCTGAAIDVPANANERVATRLGPGPARDVLADLLNGSTFNYVMVGSPSDANIVASVILSTKTAGPAGSSETVANAYQPQTQYVPPQQAVMAPGMGPGGPVVKQSSDDEEADSDEDADAEEDNTDQDQAQTQGQADNNTAVQDGTPPNQGPKTPEQILEMLRQRQNPPGQPQPFPRPVQQPPDTNEQ